MAWSSSSSSSNTPPPVKHEVFISFRSEDTRKTFTSHLNGALKRINVRTYIGNNNLDSGDEISATLLKAIEESHLSVIVFSKNYAASKWCLDELMKILECRRTRGQIVVPIFYDIDPSDVRNQRGSFAEAFVKHSLGERVKVQQWRNGLAEAANFSGWDCNVNRTELELVEEIAMYVLQKLNRVYVSDLDQQIAKLEQLAHLQDQFYHQIISVENLTKQRATVQRITELKMERSIRLLHLPPDLLQYV